MAITIDAISDSGDTLAASSITKAHTVSAGDNRGLIVCVMTRDATMGNLISGVTYDGTALTLAKAATNAARSYNAAIYYLIAPSVKTANVVVSFSETVEVSNCTILSIFGMKQSSPVSGTDSYNTTSVTSSSLAITPAADGSIVVDSLYTSDNNLTMGAGQTQLAKHGVNNNGDYIGASYERADGTRTMSWTWSGANGTTVAHAAAGFLMAAGPALLKTVNGLAVASVKVVNGLAIASIKGIDGLT